MYYTLKSSTQLAKELNSYLTLDLWKETEEAFKLELDTPGFSKNEITVTSKGNVVCVTISPKQGNKRTPFSAEYKLPNSAVVSESIAHLEDGVLKIIVPKKEQEKVNVIPIK
jgi:HSP20 family molecular chaperone IbpA